MYYFTPGPTELFLKTRELIAQALKESIPSISHRSKEFQRIYERVVLSLRTLLGLPSNFQIFFLGSATEAMERILQNCVQSRSHHFINGAFSERFFEISKELGKKPSEKRIKPGQGIDLNQETVPKDTELVAITQNETSTGAWIPPADISALRKLCPDAIVAVDVVSSAPIPDLPWKDIDCAFFSVQKCFGLPAGLGVLIVNERAIERSMKLTALGISTGSYHNFASLRDCANKFQTPETPNVLSIFLLAGITEYMLQLGIGQIRKESSDKARLIYDFLARSSEFTPFVTTAKFQSETVVSAIFKGNAKNLHQQLEAQGLQVGSGYGELRDSQIRIANFPMHSAEQLSKLLEAL